MSIADKITQLTNIRTAIRTALQNKGIAAATSHNFADFAADIAAIATGATLQSKRVSAKTTGPTYVTPDTGYDGLSQVIVNMITRQAKTVTPGTADQTVSPDSGYQGLSSVTVEGDADLVAGNIKSGVSIFGVAGSYAPSVVTQEKSVTPTASQQVVTPDSGKYLSKVTVAAAPLETKSVTPSAAQQTINPSSGKIGMSQVTVAAAPLETKTVTPTAAAQIVSPSSGKIGMSQITVAATPLQAKSVTPSASQQVITPGSSYVGLSKVTVAGDADLVAGNIKKDVVIFGVTGTYEGSGGTVNGSLIEITYSSNIDEVTATVNGHTYTANLNTSTHKAFVTIPYTDTTSARECTIKGYGNGTLITTAFVSMTAGFGYYTVTLSTESLLFYNGVWTGIDSHEWIRYRYNNYSGTITVTESSVLTLYRAQSGSAVQAWVYLSPKISNRGYSQLEITIDSISHPNDSKMASCVSSPTNITGNNLSVGTNLISCATDGFYLEFFSNDYMDRRDQTIVISKMRFV